jgi:ABC-type cobalt transport system substrate-binding protein
MALSIPLYAIGGTAFSVQMTSISLISLLVSGCVSIYITNTLSNKYSFPVSLLIALSVVAMIDGLIMKSYFTAFEVFSLQKIGSIFGRELLFKICYAVVASVITYAVGIYSSKESLKD